MEQKHEHHHDHDEHGSELSEMALERGISPGLGDNARTDMRPDLGLVGLNDRGQRRRIDIAFFDEHGLERPDPQLHLMMRPRRYWHWVSSIASAIT
jgi:hypothetical protein